MLKPIGILGGTFDPVHHGHLRLALEVLDRAGLELVRLVPVFTPPHRNQPEATPEQRREMLRLAVEGIDSLVLEGCELQRQGVSWTVDTLKEIRAGIPGRRLCLIMGMDAFENLDTWREWRGIPESSHIIVVERPGNDKPDLNPEIASLFNDAATTDPAALQRSKAGAILRITIPMLDISATRLRTMIAEGRDARFLLPQPVLDYIHRERLYLSGES